jgi:hypothetical protein
MIRADAAHFMQLKTKCIADVQSRARTKKFRHAQEKIR